MTEDDDPRARLSKIRHDLRTPLNHIIGYSEMLAEDAPEELRPDLLRIRSAALAELAKVTEVLAMLEGDWSSLASVPAARPPEEDPPADDRAGNGAAILVVDDDEANRTMLARRLEKRGYTTEMAAGGLEALARIEARPFALVILDVMMPGMSGLEVLGHIRAKHTLGELPVIMATARDASEDVVEALSLGANDYVVKPIHLSALLARVRTQLDLAARNRFIRSTFGRYLTEEIVESLLATPEGLAIGGAARVVTVLMSDVRGFSSIAERLAPSDVITLINNYLGAMTEVICRHGGTIDEFIGDAVLVIFGAPTARDDDARRALACAVDMQLAMAAVNEQNVAAGLPVIEMGVGVNTGEVVVGNIGSERRAKYGVVGRHVNLASRIQGYTVGGQILVSRSTLEAAGPGVRVDGSLDVLPKGSPEPMRIFEIGGVGESALPRRTSELLALLVPLAARLRVLDGAHVSADDRSGELTHLSRREARIRSDQPVAPLCTIRFDLSGAIYAKVLSAGDGGRDLLVHFTSVSPSSEEAIAALVDARRAAGA